MQNQGHSTVYSGQGDGQFWWYDRVAWVISGHAPAQKWMEIVPFDRALIPALSCCQGDGVRESDRRAIGYLKVFQVQTKLLIGMSYPDGRLALVDLHSDTVVLYARLPGDCRGTFDVSPNGRMLVTDCVVGFNKAIDVWQLPTGERLAKSAKTTIGVLFGPTGKDIVIQSRHGPAYVWDYADDRKRPLRFAAPAAWGFRDMTRREVLIPTCRKRQALLVSWEPIRVRNVQLPVSGVIWQVRQSPKHDVAVVSDSDGVICGLSYPSREPIWRRTFEGGCDRLCYCGNGRYIAASELQKGGTFLTQVLDAESGELLRVLALKNECMYPFKKTTVLSHRGEIIDLKTGQVSLAFSDPKWWRSRLNVSPRVLS